MNDLIERLTKRPLDDSPKVIVRLSDLNEAIAALQDRAKLEPQLPAPAIRNAIAALAASRDKAIHYREQSTMGSASYAFHNQLVTQAQSDIATLSALLPPSPNEEPKA
jgi:hypothetical protein